MQYGMVSLVSVFYKNTEASSSTMVSFVMGQSNISYSIQWITIDDVSDLRSLYARMTFVTR